MINVLIEGFFFLNNYFTFTVVQERNEGNSEHGRHRLMPSNGLCDQNLFRGQTRNPLVVFDVTTCRPSGNRLRNVLADKFIGFFKRLLFAEIDRSKARHDILSWIRSLGLSRSQVCSQSLLKH